MVSNETAHELHTERQLEALSKVGLDAEYTFMGGCEPDHTLVQIFRLVWIGFAILMS